MGEVSGGIDERGFAGGGLVDGQHQEIGGSPAVLEPDGSGRSSTPDFTSPTLSENGDGREHKKRCRNSRHEAVIEELLAVKHPGDQMKHEFGRGRWI